MKKDDNWGIAILAITLCVYFLLNFFFDESRYNQLQTEIRERVDGRATIIVHQMDNLESLINNKCSTKE